MSTMDQWDELENDGSCGNLGIEKGDGDPYRTCTNPRRHKDDHYDRVHDFSWPLDEMDKQYNEFFERMARATEDLKKMREIQDKMHWQFGDPLEFCEFRNELEKTRRGWVSSNC